MFARLLEVDARISAQTRVAERPGGLRTLLAILAHTGDSWFWILGLALVFARAGRYWQDRALVLAVGVLLTALLVMALKFTIRRRRPAGEWGRIYRKSDPHSFPSGHAARGAMLTVIALGLGPPWLAGLLLVWAPLMAISRVAMGLHYFSDVLVGVLVGVMMGLLILRIDLL